MSDLAPSVIIAPFGSNHQRMAGQKRQDRYADARRELARQETFFVERRKIQKRLNLLKWIAIVLGMVLVLDRWVLPEQYKRISDEWVWSGVLGLVVVAVILLCPGFKLMDRPSIFKRWTFWLALLSAVLLVFVVAPFRWLHGPYGILLILGAGVISFDWLSKRLSALDQGPGEES
jgi:hypothetical protein